MDDEKVLYFRFLWIFVRYNRSNGLVLVEYDEFVKFFFKIVGGNFGVEIMREGYLFVSNSIWLYIFGDFFKFIRNDSKGKMKIGNDKFYNCDVYFVNVYDSIS